MSARPGRLPRELRPLAGTRLRMRSWRGMQRLLHERPRRLRDPLLNHHVLWLPRLPLELSGLRVAQLSDIHYGMYLSRQMLTRVLELIQAQHPDLVVITGDFVTQSPVFIEPVSELVGRLRAPLGVFAVLGNHDFRAGAERLTQALRRRQIQVLRNECRRLRYRGADFVLAGVDDARQHPDVAAVCSAGAGEFTLLLAHNPAALAEAAGCGVDLVLSGHTHGGQIKLGFASRLYRRYLPEGFLRHGETHMYISRGLGKVILPMRVNAPAELTFFTLHRGTGG